MRSRIRCLVLVAIGARMPQLHNSFPGDEACQRQAVLARQHRAALRAVCLTLTVYQLALIRDLIQKYPHKRQAIAAELPPWELLGPQWQTVYGAPE